MHRLLPMLLFAGMSATQAGEHDTRPDAELLMFLAEFADEQGEVTPSALLEQLQREAATLNGQSASQASEASQPRPVAAPAAVSSQRGAAGPKHAIPSSARNDSADHARQEQNDDED